MCFLLQGSSSRNCKPTYLIFKLKPVVKCVLVPVRSGGGDRVILNWLHFQRLIHTPHWDVWICSILWQLWLLEMCIISIWCSCGRLLALLVILKTYLVLHEPLAKAVRWEFWQLNLPCAAFACCCSCQTFTLLVLEPTSWVFNGCARQFVNSRSWVRRDCVWCTGKRVFIHAGDY